MPVSPKVSYLSTSQGQSTSLPSDLFYQAERFGLEELHFKNDPATDLKAIIAIHNTYRGPALGGTRSKSYENTEQALLDVMSLAHGMSYKSAFARLPYGGGKAVLLRPTKIDDRDAYFESYGSFIESLGGRYITAVDVGTRVEDMDIIARQTSHVLSTSANRGDPSLYTAKGVFQGIRAAAKVCFGRDDLEGLKVCIQGVGKVGYHLASLLYREGVKLTFNDIDKDVLERCADEFEADVIDGSKLYSVECHVFSPCALGGILNETTVNQISAGVICGSANNQLSADQHGDSLHRRGIFYAPDYVVNAGGLIHLAFADIDEAREQIAAIYDALVDIHQRSQETNQPSHRVANQIAEAILSNSDQERS